MRYKRRVKKAVKKEHGSTGLEGKLCESLHFGAEVWVHRNYEGQIKYCGVREIVKFFDNFYKILLLSLSALKVIKILQLILNFHYCPKTSLNFR